MLIPAFITSYKKLFLNGMEVGQPHMNGNNQMYLVANSEEKRGFVDKIQFI